MFLDDIAYKVLGTRDYAKLFLWIPRVLFEIVQLWPRNKYFQIKAFISSLFCVSVMGFISVGLFQDMEFSMEKIDEVMFSITLMISTFQAAYKTIIICYKAPQLKHLLSDVFIKFWPDDLTGEDLKNKIKFFYFVVMIIMLSLCVTGVIFGVVFLFLPLLGNDRKLPFPVKYSFDGTLFPIYELLYLSHIIGFQVIMCGCILGTDCLFMGIVASAVTQYRILQKCLSQYNTPEMTAINTQLKIFNKEDSKRYNDGRKDFFVKCLKHHQLLLRFTKKVNDIYSLIVLVQLSNSIFGVCLGTYMITRESFTSDQLLLGAIVLVGYLQQLMVYCIMGNELNYQASLLPEYIYKSNWRSLEGKTLQRDVMFVIQQSQRTLQLTAFGLYDINMTSYAKVIKLGFSFYTLLSRISSK